MRSTPSNTELAGSELREAGGVTLVDSEPEVREVLKATITFTLCRFFPHSQNCSIMQTLTPC